MRAVDPRLTSPAWRRLRLLVLDRDRHVCQMRGAGCTQVATCVDHIVARHEGGDMWDPRNLRAACRSCNTRGGGQQTGRRKRQQGQGLVYRLGVADYDTRF
jgi:5-methylcytosine-specific restriction endonuclease McrA